MAARRVSQAIAADSSNVEIYLAAMALYRVSGHPRHEAALGEMLVNRIETDARFRRLGRRERAAIYAETAYAHWSAGSRNLARRCYETAYSLTPDDPVLMNNLGYFYADTGLDLTRALQLTQRAVRRNPDSGIFLDSLGWALFKSGRHGRALETLRKAVALEPDSGEIRFHVGAAYAKTGAKVSAVIELNKALILDASLSEARRLLRNLNQ